MRHKFDEDAHANAFQLTFNFKVSTQNVNISNFQQNNLHLSIEQFMFQVVINPIMSITFFKFPFRKIEVMGSHYVLRFTLFNLRFYIFTSNVQVKLINYFSQPNN